MQGAPSLAYPTGIAPGFDPSHPASNQCQISLIATAGPNCTNLLNGRVGTKTGATPVGKILTAGPGVDFTGGNDNINFAFPTAIFPVATFAAIFTLTASSANAGLVFATNGANSYGIQIVASNGAIQAVVGATGSTLLSSPTTNVPYFVAITNNGAAYNSIAARLDNGVIVTNAATGSAPTAGDGSFYVGNRGLNSRQIFGAVHAAMFSNTLLSVPQLRAWASDPWAFWYPQK